MGERAATMTKRGEPDKRSAGRDRRLAVLAEYLRAPRTVDECAAALGVKRRAVYILFDALEGRGYSVARLGPKADGRYAIVHLGA